MASTLTTFKTNLVPRVLAFLVLTPANTTDIMSANGTPGAEEEKCRRVCANYYRWTEFERDYLDQATKLLSAAENSSADDKKKKQKELEKAKKAKELERERLVQEKEREKGDDRPKKGESKSSKPSKPSKEDRESDRTELGGLALTDILLNDNAVLEKQIAFEKKVYSRIRASKPVSSASDATLLSTENLLLIHRTIKDVVFVAVVDREENEIIFDEVLNTIEESLGRLFSGEPICRSSLIENYDLLLLVLDEVLDDGLILELDSAAIADRINMEGPSSEPAGEQTVFQTLMMARRQFVNSFTNR